MGHQNSSSELVLQSDLCNFHALKALKEKTMSYPDLKIFINPILTALKSIMRSWHNTEGPVWCNHFTNWQCTELQARKGALLKLLHDPQKPAASTVFPGRLPKRHPQNSGFRRKGAP